MIMARMVRLFEGRFGRLVLSEITAREDFHSHPEPAIMLLHHGAEGAYRVGEERIAFTRDDVLLLNPDQMHRYEPDAGSAAARALAYYGAGGWLRDSFPAVFAAGNRQPFARPREAVTARIRRLADTLAIEALNDRFLAAERLEFMLQELVLSIVDTYLARRRAASPLWRGSRFEDSRIRRALALLRARPHKDYSMDHLASQVGLSRSRFYDLFQLCTGLSPRAYLDKLCVETAIARLSAGGVKIAEVSAELGFSAQSNFTRFFLNQVGIPPSEYRRASTQREESVSKIPSARE